MVPSISQSSRLSTFFVLVTILSIIVPAQALYFYVQEAQPKCFFEELPKDTLVVGTYTAEIFSQHQNAYTSDATISITVTVDETFDNDHRVVSTREIHTGRFTFTAADPGQHKICFTAYTAKNQPGWFSESPGPIKFTLDIAIGETSKIESEDKGKLDDIAQKVKGLNAKLEDIRREQVFQREREALFRDQSETTNSRVVRWTLVQLAVLSITCAWQLSHLRSFFIKQKLT